MKRVISISLGSSSRDHKVETEILGQKVSISRIGCDGNLQKARKLFLKYDDEVTSFGLGGINRYFHLGDRSYKISQANKLVADLKSPVLDGGGVKKTLEKQVINQLDNSISFTGKKVLLVSAIDRFGMAESLVAKEANLLCGDLIFALKIPLMINSLSLLKGLARVILPIIIKLPFKVLYPTGSKQEQNKSLFQNYFQRADIIAGDFHYIRYYSPDKLTAKVIITNTVTAKDKILLKNKGVAKLITTTPEFEGRAFGTNVIEALLVALADKEAIEINHSDYFRLLRRLDFGPVISDFGKGKDLANGS